MNAHRAVAPRSLTVWKLVSGAERGLRGGLRIVRPTDRRGVNMTELTRCQRSWLEAMSRQGPTTKWGDPKRFPVHQILALAAPTVEMATVTVPGATITRRTGNSGASRFRRRWTTRADARERSPNRSDQDGQHEICGHHRDHQRGRVAGCGCGGGHRGRRHLRGGVVLAPWAPTPMGTRDTDRRTPGETGGASRPSQRRRGSEPARGIPAVSATAKANRANRADSGKGRTLGGRGFDSRRLHYDTHEPGAGDYTLGRSSAHSRTYRLLLLPAIHAET